MLEKNQTFSPSKKDSSSPKKIYEVIDDQLNTEQKKLLITLNYQKKREEIEKTAKELKIDIKNLSKVIQDILDKNHKDYISSFMLFMETVRKDLKSKLEHMDKIEEEKSKLNDVNLIKCERDFFRSECVRLSSKCNSLNKKIDDMELKMKILTDEINDLTFKWKDSEIANKQLFIELEASLQAKKEIEIELEEMKEVIEKNKNKQNDFLYKDEDDSEGNMNNDIEKIKRELKRERIRNHQVLRELNRYMIEKNKLENIFIDCVEETRKLILNRKLKNINKVKASAIGLRKLNYYHHDFDVKYEMFLPQDKKALLENFVFNEEVSNIIREGLFNKPEKDHSEIERSKLSSITLMNLPPVEINETIIDPKANTTEYNKSNLVKKGNFTINAKKTHFRFSLPYKIKQK